MPSVIAIINHQPVSVSGGPTSDQSGAKSVKNKPQKSLKIANSIKNSGGRCPRAIIKGRMPKTGVTTTNQKMQAHLFTALLTINFFTLA
jgi:hypothetical protein